MSSFKILRTPPANLTEFRLPGLAEERGAPADPQGFFEPDFSEPLPPPTQPADLMAEARRILAEAEARRQHLERLAYEEGFRQGHRDGQEVGLKGLKEVTGRLAQVLTELTTLWERLFREREEEMVRLALVVARQVAGHALKTDPALLRTLVEQGFQALNHRESLKLYLHPDDLEALAAAGEDTWPPEVEVAADRTVTPGGFRLETALGEVDGTLETRWERVARAVTRVLEKGDEA